MVAFTPIPVKKKRVITSPRLKAVNEAFGRAARECAKQLAHLKGTPQWAPAYRSCIKQKMQAYGANPRGPG